MTAQSEIVRTAEYADQVLPLAEAHLSDSYFYPSVPLCVIDAVYSIGVRYGGVRRVVERYCAHFGLPSIREDRHALPPREAQESVSAFCDRFEHVGFEAMTGDVFQSRQRTSTRSGILKSEAVLRFAQALRDHDVEHFQDVPKAAEDVGLERAVRAIPGQSSGISLQYFWMLAGSDEFVKPDRMILRFLELAVGRAISVAEAQGLLSGATAHLKAKYPELTARALDHEVWKHQRAQNGPAVQPDAR